MSFFKIHEVFGGRESRATLTRRELLKGSGMVFGFLSTTSLVSTLAPSKAWALELSKLKSSEGEAILQIGRVIFPHEHLPDAGYAFLVKDIDNFSSQGDNNYKLIISGINEVNKLAGGSFIDATLDKKNEVINKISETSFFNKIRGQGVTSIYDNEIAFLTFGYPGSAWEKGGYLYRGFQDLKWLPEPTEEASPSI